MTAVRRIVFIVPNDIDSPAHPSGGNEYDRRLTAGLRDAGWAVDLRPVTGPGTDGTATSGMGPDAAVARALADVPDGSVVLVDGLLVTSAAGSLAARDARLRLVVLMHMTMAVPPPEHGWPGAAEAERSVLGAADAVITTSDWLRQQVVTHHRIDPDRVAVAPPGVEQAPVATRSPSGHRLLCVAPVAPHKGQDVLMVALTRSADLAWTCTCVGALDRAVGFVANVRATAATNGLADRVLFAGVHSRSELADDYAASDLLVLPTRSESYGMVLSEALARGLPVVASDVGGVVEAATGAVWTACSAAFPGALVPPDDPDALADRLRAWLTDDVVRAEWRGRAEERRLGLRGWEVTARRAAGAIERAANRLDT